MGVLPGKKTGEGMAEKKYQIIVDGTLTEGTHPDEAKKRLAALFKTSLEKIEPMFSGKPVTIKKGVNAESAKKYMQALKQAGLISKGVLMEQTSASTPNLGNTTLAAVGAELDNTPPATTPNIDTSGYTVSETGETLVDVPPIPQPDIDISQYQINAVGQTLDESTPPPKPDIDTSKISMGDVGEDVMEHPKVTTTDIDISQLTMADAGEEIMTHEKIPDAKIDTSKLDLV